jgi:hypothetical protein
MQDWLDQLVGDWTYESRSNSDASEHRRSGVETVRRRGNWIVIESDDDSIFHLCTDPTTGSVVGDFINWHDTSLWVYAGSLDAGRLRLASRGRSLDDDGDTDYEDVFEIISADERRVIGRLLGRNGEWRDFMVTTYRRVGGRR